MRSCPTRSICRRSVSEFREGRGFELPVPRAMQGRPRAIIAGFGCKLQAAVARLSVANVGGHHRRRVKRNLGTEALSRAEPKFESISLQRRVRANRTSWRHLLPGQVPQELTQTITTKSRARQCQLLHPPDPAHQSPVPAWCHDCSCLFQKVLNIIVEPAERPYTSFVNKKSRRARERGSRCEQGRRRR